MNQRLNLFNIFICLMFFSINCMALAEGADKKGETSWVESTDVKFDGRIGFPQTKMGTMKDLITKYKRGEKGVKIYATGKIIDTRGKVLAVFNETPA